MSTIKNDGLDQLSTKSDYLNLDYYALGIILYECFLQRSDLANLSMNTLLVSLNELIKDFDLPPKLINVIQKLTNVKLGIEDKRINDIKRLLISFNNNDYLSDKSYSNIIKYSKSLKDYDEIVNSQINHIIKYLDNPNDSVKPYTPKINNKVNLGYGLLGMRYFLNTINYKYDFGKFDKWVLSQGINNKELMPGLYTGLSGIALTMLLSGKTAGAKHILNLARNHELLTESHNYFNGVTGYGLVLLKFWEHLNDTKYLNEAKHIADYLIKIHKRDSVGNIYWKKESEDVKVGLFFGSTGVALFFLYLHLATNNKKYLEYGKKMLSFDLNQKRKSNQGHVGYPKDTSKSTVVVLYLGYGTSGILAVLIRYYAVTLDEKYRQMIEELAPTIEIKYAAFPGLFDGLSGLANTMLDLYQFLGERKYKNKANKVIKGILLFQIDLDEKVYFPGDYLKKFSLDFGSGSAGICVVLDRYVNNRKNPMFFNDTLIKMSLEGVKKYEKVDLQPSI